MIKSEEHYLIQWNHNGTRLEGKQNHNTEVYKFLMYIYVFMYFKTFKAVVNWTLESNVVLFEN